jgi:hypothetical protein
MPWPTGAQASLVRAAVAPDPDVVPAFCNWRAQIDIEGPIDGGSFRLLPLVYERLRDQGFDDPLMARLKGVHRKSWSQGQLLFRRTAPVLAALEAAGVQTMLIKGAPMALTLYPSVAARPSMDLDIVVRRDKAEQALQIMHDLGWHTGTRIYPHEMPDAHAIDLHADDPDARKGAEIDLHWHILRETPATAADDWFWNAASPLDFCGVRTLQPSPAGHLLHTVIHGVRSNLEPPLRWIPDSIIIMRAAGETLDWDALTVFAGRQKLSYRLHLGLAYLAETYAAPVPREVLDRLKANGISTIERLENIIAFRGPYEMHRPLLYPLVDYWRYRRNEPMGRFLKGYGGYLQRRWQVDHPAKLPLVALRAVARNIPLPFVERRPY